MILANTEYSLEGLMLNLKLKYFGHLMRRASSLEKTDTGKDWKQEEKGKAEDEMVGWHHWHDGHERVGSRSWWWTGKPGVLQSMGSQRVRQDWATEMNWEKVSATRMQQANSLHTQQLPIAPTPLHCQCDCRPRFIKEETEACTVRAWTSLY